MSYPYTKVPANEYKKLFSPFLFGVLCDYCYICYPQKSKDHSYDNTSFVDR